MSTIVIVIYPIFVIDIIYNQLQYIKYFLNNY
jgi:hypothetical protein